MAESDVAPHFHGDFRFNTGVSKRFSTVDYVIFAAVLGISAGIGAYFAWKDRQKKDIDDFLLAGRNMSPFPVALSLLASFMSAITLLGTPAEMYNYTTMYWWIGGGYLLVIAGAAHIYIPVFYRLGVTSAYEVSASVCSGGGASDDGDNDYNESLNDQNDDNNNDIMIFL